jgi:REP element-mobilizing transposase RayT
MAPESFRAYILTTRSEIAFHLCYRFSVKVYHGFPRRLHHQVPGWVESGAIFHIRIAIDREKQSPLLTIPELAGSIMDSVQIYEEQFRWYIRIFVLMPDHLHALVSFESDERMSTVIGDWKRFHARTNRVTWQEGFFDHRLRNDERGEQLNAKADYVRRNPVAAGLCTNPEDWPWIYPAPSSAGGSSSP